MNHKSLITGPPWSGKSYIAKKLSVRKLNAVDADEVKGLLTWVDTTGTKAEVPKIPSNHWRKKHYLNWDRKFLEKFLKQSDQIYLCGLAQNIFELTDLFDNCYFLDINSQLLRERYEKDKRNKYHYQKALKTLGFFRAKAKEYSFNIIPANLEIEEIVKILGK